MCSNCVFENFENFKLKNANIRPVLAKSCTGSKISLCSGFNNLVLGMVLMEWFPNCLNANKNICIFQKLALDDISEKMSMIFSHQTHSNGILIYHLHVFCFCLFKWRHPRPRGSFSRIWEPNTGTLQWSVFEA